MTYEPEDLACNCGCGLTPTSEAMRKINAMAQLSCGFKVSSAARCEKHNKEIGGAPSSWHVKGMAFDCIEIEDEYRFIKDAIYFNFKGIGFKNNSFIHIDLRPSNPQIWDYR